MKSPHVSELLTLHGPPRGGLVPAFYAWQMQQGKSFAVLRVVPQTPHVPSGSRRGAVAAMRVVGDSRCTASGGASCQ